MKVGDRYIYTGDGHRSDDPWTVEVVAVRNKQVAYIWDTNYAHYIELHATSRFICDFEKEFTKLTYPDGLEGLNDTQR